MDLNYSHKVLITSVGGFLGSQNVEQLRNKHINSYNSFGGSANDCVRIVVTGLLTLAN